MTKVYKIEDESIVSAGDVLLGASEVLASLSKTIGTHRRGLHFDIIRWMKENDVEFDESTHVYDYSYITQELRVHPREGAGGEDVLKDSDDE